MEETLGAWEVFKDAIFWVIEWFHSWCGDWGLAIVFITIVFRLLIFPITSRQFKSSYKMQKLQPQLKEIKEKYKDDPQRQQQETMNLYKEAKFNPLAGCLPMLLQMPIFIALYQVLQELPTRIGSTESVSFYTLVPNLTVSPGTVFSEQGILAVMPYVIMLLLFAASLVIPMLLQPNSDRNTRVMMIIMSVMMLFFGWQVPAGVLLYWDVSSYLGVAQQQISRMRMKRKDELAEEAVVDVTPVKVSVDRAERKARPKKKR
ncbi:MAG: YidC/Oxa1 family membrane protein insertase [Coriobacteriales bacterium]|jgi:YidC/Oxa1 family membrane protein insertase|nr:YidC/Oxa1 family membrane protein insertase [Coriobacteriales bacterium]